MLASVFVLGGVNALRNAPALAPAAAGVTDKLVPMAKRALPSAPIPTDAVTLVRINAGVQIVSALALATGKAPRLAAGVLAVSMAPTTVAGHAFWAETDPSAKKTQQLAFFKNLSVLGGLVIAAGDTDGQPGVAWRTKRVAKDARRQTRLLATSARREAKLAKAQLS